MNNKPKNNFSQQLKWANSISENNSNSTSRSNSTDNTAIFTPFVETNNKYIYFIFLIVINSNFLEIKIK